MMICEKSKLVGKIHQLVIIQGFSALALFIINKLYLKPSDCCTLLELFST